MSNSSISISSSSSSSSSYFNASRIHFWHYVLNEDGQPIQNAEIRFYLNDDPTTEAYIFKNDITGSKTTCSISDIKTDNDGFFEFWIGSEWEDGGYSHTQEFRLEWFKAGTRPGMIDYINPWPNVLIWRDKDTGSDREYRNKFVSDYLVNKWLTHAYAIIPSASPHDIHPVDYESGCNDDKYNKVVSNKFLYDILQGCYAGDTETITYNGVTEYSQNITSWTASGGVYYKDINHTNVKNDSSIVLIKIDDYEEIIPKKIIHIGVNTTRIVVSEDIDVIVIVDGYSASSSSVSSSSSSSSSSSLSSSSSSSSSSISSSSSSSSLSSSSSSSSLSLSSSSSSSS